MWFEGVKMKTQAIRNVVIDANVREERNHSFYLIVLDVVKAQAGKKITKRLATAIEKALPDHTVHYARDVHGGRVFDTKVTIWGNGIDYNRALRFRFGSQDCVDVAVFEENNTCYGNAAAERIAERKAWLADEQNAYDIACAHHALCDAQEEFESAVARNGCPASKYDIEKALGLS